MHWEKKLSVHSSTAYNSQDMEATQVPIDRWMDGERVVDIYIQGQSLIGQGRWGVASGKKPDVKEVLLIV